MTQVLTIPTPFADLSELTENFAQRVDEERLMLPYAEPMPEGEWLQFSVLLGDGNVALAGVGRVQGSFDNGEEHPPEYRFDVVLDSLQFEGMNEVMFERLLMARSSLAGGEPVTGEVSVEELERQAAAQAAVGEAESEPEPVAAEEPAAAESDWDAGETVGPMDVGTGDLDVGELAEASPYEAEAEEPVESEAVSATAPSQPPAPPVAAAVRKPSMRPYPTVAREPGKLPSPHTFEARALTRPSLEAAWTPEPALRPEAAQSSGYFDYQGGVPRPAHPPRPELDPSLRVIAAPRPGAPWPRAQAVAVAAAAAVAVAASEPPPAEAGYAEAGFAEAGAEAGFEDAGLEEEPPSVEMPVDGEQEW